MENEKLNPHKNLLTLYLSRFQIKREFKANFFAPFKSAGSIMAGLWKKDMKGGKGLPAGRQGKI